MGLFDGARHDLATRLHRPRRQAARRTGGAGGRRRRPGPLGGRARRTGSAATTRGSGWAGSSSTGSGPTGTRRCCGTRSPTWACPCWGRYAGTTRSRRRRGTWVWCPRPNAPRRRSVRSRGSATCSPGRSTWTRCSRSPATPAPLAGTPWTPWTPPPRSPRARGSVPSSRSPAARRSRSPTPSTPSCWQRPGRGSCPWTRCATSRCPPAPPRSSSAAASRRCTRARLSANERLRAQVAGLARSGAPVVAECAGLLYLVRDTGRPAHVRRPRRDAPG